MPVSSFFHVRAIARVMPVVLAAALGACSSFDQGTRNLADALTLYRPEVVQGNFVSREQVGALQPGSAGTTCSPCSARAWRRSATA